MKFTIQRPDGTTERRQHIAYSVRQTGPTEWTAYTTSGRVLGRSTVSESSLRTNCNSCTESVKTAQEAL